MNQAIEAGAKVVHDMNGHSPEMDYAHIPEAWKTHCRIVARAVFHEMVQGLTDEQIDDLEYALDRAESEPERRAALLELTEVDDG